jgi:NTP pyrophosphatase (non-canonical NTP hydrolase)
MNAFEIFQQDCLRTAGKYEKNLSAIAMSLAGELGELISASNQIRFRPDAEFEASLTLKMKLALEAGDILWSVFLLYDAIDVKYTHFKNVQQSYSSVSESLIDLSIEILSIVEIIKKHEFQGHTISQSQVDYKLSAVIYILEGILSKQTFSNIFDVMQMNMDKRLKRYPKGFNVDASVNRNENE